MEISCVSNLGYISNLAMVVIGLRVISHRDGHHLNLQTDFVDDSLHICWRNEFGAGHQPLLAAEDWPDIAPEVVGHRMRVIGSHGCPMICDLPN